MKNRLIREVNLSSNNVLIGVLVSALVNKVVGSNNQNSNDTSSSGNLRLIDYTADQSDLERLFLALQEQVIDTNDVIKLSAAELSSVSVLISELLRSQNSVDFVAQVEALNRSIGQNAKSSEISSLGNLVNAFTTTIQSAKNSIDQVDSNKLISTIDRLSARLDESRQTGIGTLVIPSFPGSTQAINRLSMDSYFSYMEVYKDMSATLLAQINLIQAEKVDLAAHLSSSLQNSRDLASIVSEGFDEANSMFGYKSGQLVEFATEYLTPSEALAEHDTSSNDLSVNIWLVLQPNADETVSLKTYANMAYKSFVSGDQQTSLSSYPNSASSSITGFIAMGSTWFWDNREHLAGTLNGVTATARQEAFSFVLNDTGIRTVGHPLKSVEKQGSNLGTLPRPTNLKVRYFICGVDQEVVSTEGKLPCALALAALNVDRAHHLTVSHFVETGFDRAFVDSQGLTGEPLIPALETMMMRTLLNMPYTYSNGSTDTSYSSVASTKSSRALRRLFGSDRSTTGGATPVENISSSDVVVLPVLDLNYETIRSDYDVNGDPVVAA